MDLERIILATTGAIVGVFGWLLVGLFINRREYARRARNAGRAVYFELTANQLSVFTALTYGAFGQMSRATFDRLLPELATWLPAAELQSVALAYLGHDGYEQARTDASLPDEVRRMILRGVNDAQLTALDLLRPRIFTAREIAELNRYATEPQRALVEAAAKEPSS
ncbi:MAG: hypothetical protein ABIP01_03275 [Candidatus Limnocylindria bacterium]